MKIALCILVRNERPCLEVMFPRIGEPGPKLGYDAIVAIDGGSTDGTVEYLRERGVTVFGQSRRGRGEAFHIAFREVEADAYLFFSPDGNETPDDLPRFRTLLANGADLVIASRMMKGAVNEEDENFFKFRKWANNAFTLAANLGFRRSGPYITDTINGYRAITRQAVEALELDAVDYTIEYQMTIRCLKHGMRIVEFPTVEGQRIAGDTGAPAISTGLRFLRCLGRELASPRRS